MLASAAGSSRIAAPAAANDSGLVQAIVAAAMQTACGKAASRSLISETVALALGRVISRVAATSIEENLCPICIQLLVDPVTTRCGHHFCAVCWRRLQASARGELGCCPVCRKPLGAGARPNLQLAASLSGCHPELYKTRIEELRQEEAEWSRSQPQATSCGILSEELLREAAQEQGEPPHQTVRSLYL